MPRESGRSKVVDRMRAPAESRAPAFRHSASSRAFTPVFDGLWTRVNALMAHAGYWSSYHSFGEYGRQVLCALQFALLIHHCVGRSYQLRDDAAAAGDRIALIASGLEEIRGGHSFAPRQRHGDDIEAIAIAGEVHHLELGRTQYSARSLRAREDDGIQQLLRLQQRTNVQIQIQRMDAEAFGRVRQLVVRAPGIGHASAESDHAFEHPKLPLQGFLRLLG